jgi:hypothetical protein
MSRINEDVNSVTNEEKKKMKKNSASAYSTMKQKLKTKIYPLFEEKIKEFLAKGE